MKSKIMISVIICMFVISCAIAKPITTQDEADKCGPYPSDYQEKIQAYFSRSLYDPYSAHYEFFEPFMAKDGKKYGWKCMMTVNAKNRMGGYVGAKRYHFMINRSEMWMTDTMATGIYNGLSR